ncbi:DNA polymerase III subunit alpha, partial [Buchnera aphidicola (Hormaphis cornu)]
MNNPKFIHLRLHTDYSMVDGLANPYQCIKKAFDLNMVALGITDVNNLFGMLKFYKYAHQLGIKPILGIDFNIQSNIFQNKLNRITLIAANYQGYKNLILLSTAAYKSRSIQKSVFIKQHWLTKYNKGLIVLSGGCYSDIGICLLNKNFEVAYKYTKFYLKYFPNSFYLEIFRTNRIHEEMYLIQALKLAVAQNIPVVATNEVCFLEKEDLHAHKIRIAINKGILLNDVDLSYQYTNQNYFRSEKEMCELFQDIPQVLQNSVEIAKRCNVFFSVKQYFLPQFYTGDLTTDDFLISKAKLGLKNRLKKSYPNQFNNVDFQLKYKNRLNLELTVINKMGFSGYFLIVMEFIQWAKKNKIAVGPGRGSGAGSLVAYVLQITEIDPIAFDLLFERFLNPERISLPDFDIDFCMEKRDQVIEHVSNLYGTSSVSQIITFGRMTAKAVVRDVGRVLGYPYGFVNRISKLIPIHPGITLSEAFVIEEELQNLYNKDEGVKLLINTAKKLEGVIRNVGKHAGGVIIVPGKVTDFSPLYFDEEGKNAITQFDKDDIEAIGLVKFDFLGLRTLTVIQKTVTIINKKKLIYNKGVLNINSITLNDKHVFKELKQSNTTAIFQLESIGMKELIKRLQPDSFEDLLALLALFRPGPLQSGMVDNFINRKHGKELIYYPDSKWEHQSLKPILESTYGIILYQEQVMKIA